VEGAIAVLNVGGMNDNVQQETQRVDQDVPFATLDLLARVLAGSWALRYPIRHQFDRSGNEGHGGPPQGHVQASTSGALQKSSAQQ
jgi:hypothetical protein